MHRKDREAFRTWLAAQAPLKVSGIKDVPIKSGPMPATPDRCIAVMNYDPGTTVQNWQGDYRVQIRCRGAKDADKLSSYNDCDDLADAVIAAVAPPGDVLAIATLAGGRRATVTKIGDKNPVGPDQAGRWEMTINVALAAARV